MKIPLIYPKIPENSNKFSLNKCVAFEKIDGTCMHFSWNMPSGWHHFGTRRTQFFFNHNGIKDFTQVHPELMRAPHIFNDKLRDVLTAFLSHDKRYKFSEVVVFAEFYGPHSFAGTHAEEDVRCNAQNLVVIDVSVDGKIIPPQQLINDFDRFGGFDVATVIYSGKYSGQFVEDVKKGKYPVNEGVVVKGVVDGEVFMTKIKTKDYLKRLRQR